MTSFSAARAPGQSGAIAKQLLRHYGKQNEDLEPAAGQDSADPRAPEHELPNQSKPKRVALWAMVSVDFLCICLSRYCTRQRWCPLASRSRHGIRS